MNNSFYNGISGIKTYQFGLDIYANNISNVNSTGFKGSSPEFSTIFSQTINDTLQTPTTNEIGIGSQLKSSALDFSEGTKISSQNPFDMSITGDGWFGLQNEAGNPIYTRAGLFGKDGEGFLVDSKGNYLLGTSSNNIQDNTVVADYAEKIMLTTPEEQTNIQLIDPLTVPAQPTTNVTFHGSLNPEKIYKYTEDGDKVEVGNQDTYITSLINADGSENDLQIKFTKVVPQAPENIIWDATATILDQEKNVISTQDGQLNFNSKGALIQNGLQTIDNNGTPITLNFGTPYDAKIANSGFDGISSFNGTQQARSIETDGKQEGTLVEYSVKEDGTVLAAFDNGKNVPISKIGLYHFQNNGGLEQTSPIYFESTANSGAPIFFKDQNGNTIDTATISTYSLETSNVSLNTALTELIVMQKAFDASSKSITTSDELIQNAINMKK